MGTRSHFLRTSTQLAPRATDPPSIVQRALSPREEQVLELAESGHANKAIAISLGISESSVATFLRRARKKSCTCPCVPTLPLASQRRAPAPPSRVADIARAPRVPVAASLRISRTVAKDARIASARPTHAPVSGRVLRARGKAPSLTPSEQAVIELALAGLSNAAIARKRRCSVRTVANQLNLAYQKLRAFGRRELRAVLEK